MILICKRLVTVLIKYIDPCNTAGSRETKDEQISISTHHSFWRGFIGKDRERRESGSCRYWDTNTLGDSCFCDFLKTNFCFLYWYELHVSRELMLIQVTVSHSAWNTNSKKLKEKSVHTANKEIAAVPLSHPSSPLWSQLYITHRIDHTEEKHFQLMFWWTVFVVTGCSLKYVDLF